MRLYSFPVLVLSALLIGSQATLAANRPDYGTAPVEPPPDGTIFQSVWDKKQDPGNASMQLRHAEVARSGEWVASLYAVYKTRKGQEGCTAAMVGPKAVLTAAHCVPPNHTIKFKFNGKPDYVAHCDIPTAYGPTDGVGKDPSADFALCLVDGTGVVGPLGMAFEYIETHVLLSAFPDPDNHDPNVVLTGFGCIGDAVANQYETDGKYRVGKSRIVETSENTNRGRADIYYKPSERNNLITSDDKDYANLCTGDSGGPAFLVDFSAPSYSKRKIIAVNSRVLFDNKDQSQFSASLLSATGGPDFRAWATAWAGKKIEVCGIWTESAPCR